MQRIAPNRRRSRTSCSILALATVMAVGATPAAAASFKGSGTIATNTGGAASITTGATTTTVTLNPGQTVVNWTPTDNAVGTGTNISFQDAGTTALFTSTGNFAVLNNINPADISRAIVMNGTVNSRVNGVQGGSVYFYSPSGFVLGGSSVFNVGSLVVTASPITMSGSNFITNFGTENRVEFGQALNANATIVSGGSIDARIGCSGVCSGEGNGYVALVAPHVVHSGNINVNGSAALVAAEAATISFSTDGLFDIQVTAGTTSASGLDISGNVVGSTPLGSSDKQGVYLVAVPKNQLLTMVISNGADLGFTLANNAAIDDNGVVVLSAGHDINNGLIDDKSAAPGTGTASIQLTGAHATSNVVAEATGAADLYSVIGSATTTFDSSLTVHADQYVRVGAGATSTLTVGGTLSLSSDGSALAEGGSVTGGETTLYSLDNGTVTIGGNVFLTSVGSGSNSSTFGLAGGAGTGGTVNVQAAGGDITIAGDLFASANGQGGSSNGGSSGLGTGGHVDIYANAGGTLGVGGRLDAYARGTGGYSNFQQTSGDGHGGHIQLRALADGNVAIANGIYADVTGSGGFVGFAGSSGNGTGGDIELQAQGGNSTFDAGDNVVLIANGQAGDDGECLGCGGGLGDGTGGNVVVGANNGSTLTLPGTLTMAANGYGAEGVDLDGGTGTGGHVQLYSADNSTVNLTGDLYADADGFGGWRIEGGYGGDLPVVAGNGAGGLAEILTFGAGASDPQLLIGGDAFVTAEGTGGDVSQLGGGTAGNGTGGTALINSSLGDIKISGNAALSGEGRGGDANGIIGDAGVAGNGTGGFAKVSAGFDSKTTITGNVSASADGFGGVNSANGTAGNGTGGWAELFTYGSSAAHADLLASVDIHADGWGGASVGNGTGGQGGVGFGGQAYIDAQVGALDIGANAIVTASGHGGDAAFGTGGIGNGRNAEIDAFGGGALTIDGTAQVDVSGLGGDGQTGGDGIGGGEIDANSVGTNGAHIFANNGSVAITGTATVGASGQGGAGVNGGFSANGGTGGNGQGGWATVTAGNNNNGPSSISLTALNIGAGATGGAGGQGGGGSIGGNGGDGGNAIGGLAAVAAAAGNGHLQVTTVNASAVATGGAGGDGGNGDGQAGGSGGAGGDAEGGGTQVGTISGNGQAAGSNLGTATYGTVTMNGSAFGGDGGNGGSGSPDGNGGAGGEANGGGATLLVRGSQVTVTGATSMTANGTGGDGGTGGGATGLQGVGGNGLSGEIAVLVTSRFQLPTQLGTLTTGGITGTAAGIGGLGSTNGQSILLGGSLFQVDRGTANLASLDFTISGDTVAPGSDESRIAVTNGTVNVTSQFGFSTDGDLSFYIDNGALNAGSLALHAGNFVSDTLNPAAANRGTATADSATITTGGDFIADADFDIGSSLTINAPGLISAHDFTVDGDLDLIAQSGGITAHDLGVTGRADLDAFGAINLNLVSAGLFHAEAGTTFTSDDITSDSNIQIFTGGNVTLGDLVAGPTADINSNKAIRIDSGGSVLVGNILAAGGIDITAETTVTGGNVTSGDGVFTDAGGAIVYGNISGGIVNPQPPSEQFSVGMKSGTSITVGNVEGSQGIGFLSAGALTTGDIDTNADFLVLAHGNIDTGDINANGRVYLADFSMFTDLGGTVSGDNDIDPEVIFAATPVATGGSITVGDVVAGSFQAAAGTSLTTGTLDTDSGIELHGGGAITTDDITAGDFVLANGGSITLGNVDADSLTLTSTAGNITTGDISAFGDVDMDAFVDIITGDITAGSIDLAAGDDITTGDLTTQQLLLFALGDGIHTLLFPGASITLESGGDISTGDISSIDGVYANAGGAITTGTIDANDFVELFAVDDILTSNIFAYDFIQVESSGGGIDTGNLTAGTIDLDAAGAIAFDDVNGYDFDFSAGGNVTGGDINVFVRASGDAGGSVTLGNITAGPSIPVDDFSVGIAAIGNISVGNVSGAGHVGFATQGNLSTGNLSSGDLVMTLAGGNTTTGSITTGADGQVYMADDSMFLTGGGTLDGEGDFDPSIVLALDPVATGGSITINGPVSTSLFRAAAGTGLTTQTITADGIDASAGGTATLNGIWNFTDFVTLESNDIDITGTGGIDGGTTGDVLLISSNPTQMLIGDGVSGTGYALSNAEFGRVSGTDIGIVGRGDASAAIDMLVGDLNVTGPLAGSNIEGPDGVLAFAVGDIDSESPSGVIRVVGDLNATGFGANNSIEFYATRFELDAATGSISIFSSGSTLGGELGLYASRIHVAEGSILDKLAANPTYTNYQQDLDKAATVQRPDGVLRADSLFVDADGLQDLLIQNTGTFETRAGFLARNVDIPVEEAGSPAGSINLVVNGQVVTEGGTLTGIDARDALVTPEDPGIAAFTPNSTINGCPLTGACIIKQPEPPPTANVVDSQIDLITGGGLGDGEFGNEDSIDDNDDSNEGANNPISPPQPLFDTRPLIPSSDVDDPVSGTGNPALLGGDQCDEDDKSLCSTKKEDGQ